MEVIKSFSVGNGDMFYILHKGKSFTIIDCCLSDQNKDKILEELDFYVKQKAINRFISTHPDEDHLHGLKLLDRTIYIENFYCVKNNAIENNETEDFEYYRWLRINAFYIYKGCKRIWLNQNDEINSYNSARINFLWPDTNNAYYKQELELASKGLSFNNISPIFTCTLYNGITAMWMGDIENSFLEKVKDDIDWPSIDILFAPHHGRESGKVPSDILEKLNPFIIVIGEAPSQHLNYYSNYNTITQNSAGDIIFLCTENNVHVYTSKLYSVKYLYYNNCCKSDNGNYYIGSFFRGDKI